MKMPPLDQWPYTELLRKLLLACGYRWWAHLKGTHLHVWHDFHICSGAPTTVALHSNTFASLLPRYNSTEWLRMRNCWSTSPFYGNNKALQPQWIESANQGCSLCGSKLACEVLTTVLSPLRAHAAATWLLGLPMLSPSNSNAIVVAVNIGYVFTSFYLHLTVCLYLHFD